ncbi:O-antigen ligase family protein [Photobacterium rosenbergii]|uniref:O-antigen ligase family protein n=1 Tax=Photobacterium rosenbergii TaxID=294936 RepID=UPI001C99456F|nr:O-antigen ligase family protein [Photobacterium rosenbergii]MBY5946356.1 O-antigen ligase family protein [Photobacterium rosenbergii]
MAFSLHYLLYYSGLFMLCCVLYQATHGQAGQIFKFNIVLSFLLFISVGVAFWVSVYFGQSVNNHTILSFSNPRFLNQVQVWLVIPLLYLSVLALKRQKSSRTTSFALMLSVAVIIATDARGISIALMATVLLWSLIDKTWRWQILLVSSKVIVAGFLLKIIFLSPLLSFIFADGSLEFVSIRTDSPGRIQLWKDSLSFINFWGNGGGFFICTSENNAVPRFGHPHNSILQFLIEWGVIAVISYCLLLALLLYKVVTTNRRAVRVSGLSLLAGFAYSFVSGVLVMPLSQLLAVLSISIFWRCCTGKSENLKEQNMKGISFLLMSF